MRLFAYALLLTTFLSLTPASPAQGVWPPRPTANWKVAKERAVARKANRDKTQVLFWSIVAAAGALGIGFGAYKMLGDLRQWRDDVVRDRKPWERGEPGAW